MEYEEMLKIIEEIDETYGVSLDSSDIGPGDLKNMTPEQFKEQAILAARYLRQKQGKPPIEGKPAKEPVQEPVLPDISKITDADELARIVAAQREQREEAEKADYLAKRQKRLKRLRGKKAAGK